MTLGSWTRLQKIRVSDDLCSYGTKHISEMIPLFSSKVLPQKYHYQHYQQKRLQRVSWEQFSGIHGRALSEIDSQLTFISLTLDFTARWISPTQNLKVNASLTGRHCLVKINMNKHNHLISQYHICRDKIQRTGHVKRKPLPVFDFKKVIIKMTS